MQKTNNNTPIGFFERPIEELTESKTVKELKETGEEISQYFTEAKCRFKRVQFKQKDGSLSEPRYILKVQLHSAIEETITSKECPLINRNEFALLCLEFMRPIDTDEISFTAYVRYLRGVSDSVNIKSEDKSFVRVELYISPNLSPLGFFLNNGTALLINRLSKLSTRELAEIKAERFIGKQFRLDSKSLQVIEVESAVTSNEQQ